MKVLVVEDEHRLASILRRALSEAGHAVQVSHDGVDGLHAASCGVFDVIVLDWMLPGLDGPTVCVSLRDRGITTPVLLLTARDQVADRVAGLDALADDYLSKPFSLDELLARIRALGRRAKDLTLPIVDVGDLHVDAGRRVVRRGSISVPLTAREFDVLLLLAQNAGRCVTRQQILDEVWDGETDLRSNVIDVHIASLRTKIDRPFSRESIQTLRGAGYSLSEDGG
ncbi:MAG: two-component system response regulator TcrA [Mycobacteriales bacterium]